MSISVHGTMGSHVVKRHPSELAHTGSMTNKNLENLIGQILYGECCWLYVNILNRVPGEGGCLAVVVPTDELGIKDAEGVKRGMGGYDLLATC